MRNAYKKIMKLSEIADQVDSEYIEEAHKLHPYDYDGAIMVDETGAILDGFHRAAGIIAYTKENEQDSDCYVDVIVVTHSNTIGIVADRNHRLHTKLVGLVANRV